MSVARPVEITSSAGSSPSTPTSGRLVGPWAARTVVGPAADDVVLAGNRDALYTVSNNSTPVQTLRALDPDTGQVLASRRDTDINGPAVILADRLWMVASSQHGDRLQALDLRTLATRSSIASLGSNPMHDTAIVGAVARTQRIYLVYNGDFVAVIDASRARVVRQYRISGGEVNAVVDPGGTRMYVVTTATRHNIQTQKLTVRNPDTGAVLLTSGYQPQISPGLMGVIAASRGGVWVSEGSGMSYRAAFHPADDLASSTDAGGESDGGLPITVTFSSNLAWLGSATTLLCADPDNGAVRASTDPSARGAHPRLLVDITRAGSRMYADYYGRNALPRLVTIRPPHVCHE